MFLLTSNTDDYMWGKNRCPQEKKNEIRSGFKNFKKPISQYKKIKNKKNQKIQTQVIV